MCLDLLTRVDGNFTGFLQASSPPLDAPGNSYWDYRRDSSCESSHTGQTLSPISGTLWSVPWWHLNPWGDICVWVDWRSRKKQTANKEKPWNEKLLSLHITLPNTYFYSIIALPSCIFIFFFNPCFKNLWCGFFFFNFLLWKPILLSMESHSFNSSPVCSEIVSFLFGIRRKTTLKPKFTPIKLNIIAKRQRHSLTS